MAAFKQDQRNGQLLGLDEIERNHFGEQIRGGEVIAIPDVCDLLVSIVGRKLGQIAVGGIGVAISHHAAVIANPFALKQNVFDRYGLTGGAVGSDRLELSHSLGVPFTVRGVHGEAPASALAFRSVDQLADAYVSIQPFRVTFGELQTEKATPAMAEDEYSVLAELLPGPCGHFLCVSDHALGSESWRDGGRIGKEIGLAGGALIPLHDREVFLQAAGKPPAHRDRDIAWPAMGV